jgi:hypothetical protein
MAESKGSLIAKSVSKHAGRAKEKVRDAFLPSTVVVSIVFYSVPAVTTLFYPFFFQPAIKCCRSRERSPVAVGRVLFPLRPPRTEVPSTRFVLFFLRSRAAGQDIRDVFNKKPRDQLPRSSDVCQVLEVFPGENV